jgi:autotransporter translocation and assembly factor TamB
MTARRVAEAIAIVLAGVALVAASAWVHLDTSVGRTALAERIGRSLSAEVPGTVTIGGLSEVSADEVVAARFTIADPDGREVLDLHGVRVDPDVSAMLGGVIALESGHAERGRLELTVGPSGRTRIEDALSGQGEGPPAQLDLRDLSTENLTIFIQPTPDDRFVLERARGTVVIRQGAEPGVLVDILRAGARVREPTVLGAHLVVTAAEGKVSGRSDPVLELRFRGEVDGGVRGTVRYYARRTPSVEVDLHPLGLRTVVASVGAWVSSLSSDDVDIALHF